MKKKILSPVKPLPCDRKGSSRRRIFTKNGGGNYVIKFTQNNTTTVCLEDVATGSKANIWYK